MELTHKPVLLNECLEGLNIRPDGIYVDGTLGRAGHSREIARRLTTGRLIAIDRDQAALEAAPERFESHLDKVTLIHGNFGDVAAILRGLNIPAVDGMLFVWGVLPPAGRRQPGIFLPARCALGHAHGPVRSPHRL